MSIVDVLTEVRKTNVTKTIHREPYHAISPTRPELSQAGCSVLITGGGTGAGLAMAQAFIRASASTIIIIGRRAEVLETARLKLEDVVESAGTGARIIARPCDGVNASDIDALWQYLSDQNISVDVYVANAAKFTEPTPMMELGTEEVWSQIETNVWSPLYFTEKFCKQSGTKPKYIVNVATANIHGTQHPAVAARAAYTMSKLAGTMFFQCLAQDIPQDKVQVISFHPGLIYNDYWKSLGVDPKHFDDDRLTGAFAVWAASKEAAFLHGRFAWCSWDVEELATGQLRKRLDEDFYFLRVTVSGLNAGNLA